MNKGAYIEKYIEDFEKGNITVEEIAKKEALAKGGVYRELRRYYASQNKTVPKILESIELLKEYLKKGLTEEKIKEIASSKEIIIPKRYLAIAERELEKESEKELKNEKKKKGENVKE